MNDAFSKARRFIGWYGIFAVLVLVLQVLIETRGWGFSPAEHAQVPTSLRQSPGGYRSYHFWHSGLHGGK